MDKTLFKECGIGDANAIYEVINDAAKAYKGIIPADRYHEPYMPMEELLNEMRQIAFFGYVVTQKIVGVMGLQTMEDVTLLRHAYVLKRWQGRGIGSNLLGHILGFINTRLVLVGTWADAHWAVNFYREHGFAVLPNKDELLRRYWNIPDRQRETSVVLGLEINLPTTGKSIN